MLGSGQHHYVVYPSDLGHPVSPLPGQRWPPGQGTRHNQAGARRRLLRKHGYPPDKRDEAVVTVIEQAEAVCRDWAEAA